jgi:DNA-directed RNA polymerase I subunit RPA2
MERDALIAHGTSFLLQDRLMNCSDYSTTWVCRTCGSLISLGYDDGTLNAETSKSTGPGGEYCRVCREGTDNDDTRVRSTLGQSQNPNSQRNADITIALPSDHVLQGQAKGTNLDIVAVPFVFRYLCAELASMGIAVSLEVR